MNRVIILAPHTDDGELGCGGTIAKFLEEGKDVFYVAFSACEESVPEGFPKDILKRELYSAVSTLGIKKENVITFSFKVRNFAAVRQQILQEIINLKKQINPELALIPSTSDLHQDHQVVTNEGIRAFKHTSILGYELPWNHINFSTLAFIGLEDRHLYKKWSSLESYQTQKTKPYFNKEFIRGLATVRGVQAGKPFAEAFEVIRVIF